MRAVLGSMALLAVAAPSWAQAQPNQAKEQVAVEQTIHGNICWALTSGPRPWPAQRSRSRLA